MDAAEEEIAKQFLHHCRITNLIYDLNRSLSDAGSAERTLSLCAEFSQRATQADQALALFDSSPSPQTARYPESNSRLNLDTLLDPNHPFSQKTRQGGGIWQWARSRSAPPPGLESASAALAVPMKNRDDRVIGSILVWRQGSAEPFGHEDTELLQL